MQDIEDIEEADIEEEELDTSWLDHFKAAEYNYKHFYKEPVQSVQLSLLYINSRGRPVVRRGAPPLATTDGGWIKRERIMAELKYYQKQKYKLHSVLRYNIDLNPEEIDTYVHTPVTPHDPFLTAVNYLDDIHFRDSVALFHDLNALYFIYVSVIDKTLQQTKKIKLTHKTTRNKSKKNLKITKEIK